MPCLGCCIKKPLTDSDSEDEYGLAAEAEGKYGTFDLDTDKLIGQGVTNGNGKGIANDAVSLMSTDSGLGTEALPSPALGPDGLPIQNGAFKDYGSVKRKALHTDAMDTNQPEVAMLDTSVIQANSMHEASMEGWEYEETIKELGQGQGKGQGQGRGGRPDTLDNAEIDWAIGHSVKPYGGILGVGVKPDGALTPDGGALTPDGGTLPDVKAPDGSFGGQPGRGVPDGQAAVADCGTGAPSGMPIGSAGATAGSGSAAAGRPTQVGLTSGTQGNVEESLPGSGGIPAALATGDSRELSSGSSENSPTNIPDFWNAGDIVAVRLKKNANKREVKFKDQATTDKINKLVLYTDSTGVKEGNDNTGNAGTKDGNGVTSGPNGISKLSQPVDTNILALSVQAYKNNGKDSDGKNSDSLAGGNDKHVHFKNDPNVADLPWGEEGVQEGKEGQGDGTKNASGVLLSKNSAESGETGSEGDDTSDKNGKQGNNGQNRDKSKGKVDSEESIALTAIGGNATANADGKQYDTKGGEIDETKEDGKKAGTVAAELHLGSTGKVSKTGNDETEANSANKSGNVEAQGKEQDPAKISTAAENKPSQESESIGTGASKNRPSEIWVSDNMQVQATSGKQEDEMAIDVDEVMATEDGPASARRSRSTEPKVKSDGAKVKSSEGANQSGSAGSKSPKASLWKKMAAAPLPVVVTPAEDDGKSLGQSASRTHILKEDVSWDEVGFETTEDMDDLGIMAGKVR